MPNSAGYARMSRCHYVLIAETVRDLPLPLAVRLRVALEFAGKLKLTNPRFDASRFMQACGVES